MSTEPNIIQGEKVVIMFGSERIPELEDQISALSSKTDLIKSHIRGLIQHGKANATKLDPYFSSHLKESSEKLLAYWPNSVVHEDAGWSIDSWISWSPPVWNPDDKSQNAIPSLIRIGEFLENRKGGINNFRIPAFAPFIGQNRTIIIKTKDDEFDKGLSLLQSLLIRISAMLPHQATFTLLDPAGNGAAFPMHRHLSNVRESGDDTRRDLDRVIQDIQRINRMYLDASSPSFEVVDPKLRINERFQFVFAADFPNKYDRRAIEALQSIANTGPRTGTYVFIHNNADHELPRDLSLDEFKNAAYIDLTAQGTSTACHLKFIPDRAPDAQLQDIVFERLRTAKPPERKVDWALIEPKSDWWIEEARENIATSIGVSGASGELAIWFGVNQEKRPCAHGMLGAMTGAGKTTLYHILILGLCTRYSPKELRLYLIDGKDGVGFQPYRNLPHAEVVSLKTPSQLSRSVLAELVSEKERRNKIFTIAGVEDLSQYRKLGQPQGILPRILLLVDEYQELFDGDKDGQASNLLLELAQQGRSVGIHMLLGSQHFGAVGMQHQSKIFGNIHLRMAMQMTNSDIQALTEFGRRGKQLIMTCDLPGKIVINDKTGDDAANLLGKVAYLEDDRRKLLIEQLIQKAKQELSSKDLPATVVFDGSEQPNLIENPYIEYLLHQPNWLTAQEFQEMARRSIHEEGLNITDWFVAEKPQIAWLGQEFSVRGQVGLVFRRRTSEHGMIIGSSNAVRYGMLASVIASLVLGASPDQVQFVVLDRSIPGTAWNPALQQVVDFVLRPAGYQTDLYKENRDAETILEHLMVELKRRQQLDETELLHQPSVFAIMTELDRVDALRRRADTYSMAETPLGSKLNQICVEGSPLGIHLLLSFASVRPMASVVDERRSLLNFRHRVSLQMSEDESLTFVRSRRAAQLQTEGTIPICALYLDIENDRSVRFKPYSIESTIDFSEQLKAIGNQLTIWRKSI